MDVWDDRDPALAWALSNAMSEERAPRGEDGEDQDAEDESPEDAGAREEGGTHGKG